MAEFVRVACFYAEISLKKKKKDRSRPPLFDFFSKFSDLVIVSYYKNLKNEKVNFFTEKRNKHRRLDPNKYL